jgi:cytoskeletal protein CcmA (bactofilin family)
MVMRSIAKTLIIGEGISLSGEVTSCDRLIVEGTIEAKLEKCQHVIIAETGVFNGNASTENADVRERNTPNNIPVLQKPSIG